MCGKDKKVDYIKPIEVIGAETATNLLLKVLKTVRKILRLSFWGCSLTKENNVCILIKSDEER